MIIIIAILFLLLYFVEKEKAVASFSLRQPDHILQINFHRLAT